MPKADPAQAALKRLPPATLADTIGRLHDDAKRAAQRLDDAKAEFRRRGRRRILGDRYQVQLVTGSTRSLDTAAIKAAQPQHWLDRFLRDRPRTEVRVSRRPKQ